jgi:hypothetical protein
LESTFGPLANVDALVFEPELGDSRDSFPVRSDR